MNKKIYETGMSFIHSRLGIIVAYLSSGFITALMSYFLITVKNKNLTFMICALLSLGMGITGITIATVRAYRLKNSNA